MNVLIKVVRGLASITLFGGFIVLIIDFLPLIALIPLNMSTGLLLIMGGLLTAAWRYFLKVKNIINIVTPVIPIPNWVLGIVMAIAGMYGMVTNVWDETHLDPEVVIDNVKPSTSAPEQKPIPEPMPESASILKPEIIKPDEYEEGANKLEQAKKV